MTPVFLDGTVSCKSQDKFPNIVFGIEQPRLVHITLVASAIAIREPNDERGPCLIQPRINVHTVNTYELHHLPFSGGSTYEELHRPRHQHQAVANKVVGHDQQLAS